MQYTSPSPFKTTVSPEAEVKAQVSFNNLKSALMSLPDPRRQNANLDYPLWAMLLAALAALLSGQVSLLSTAEWLAAQDLELKQALGFEDEAGRTPHQTTFQRLFIKVKSLPLQLVLTAYFDPQAKKVGEVPPRGSQALAIDGKCLKGLLKFQFEGTATRAGAGSTGEAMALASSTQGIPVHLLSLFCQQSGLVLGQIEVPEAKNEASSAPALLEQIEWPGRVLTGDAAYCHRALCKQVVEAGGDYLFMVKGNQPGLKEEIETLFDPKLLVKGLPFDLRQAKQIDKGHGRIEIRQAVASEELAGISNWPYLSQVVEIKREWLEKGQSRQAFSYAVSSLPRGVAEVERLLELKRGHWGIENQLHWVRDVVFGEDQSLIRKGSAPQVMAALRNTVIGLLRKAGYQRIKAELRYNASHPERLLTLLDLVSYSA